MRFHCPGCGVKVKTRDVVPPPEGKTIRVECPRCQQRVEFVVPSPGNATGPYYSADRSLDETMREARRFFEELEAISQYDPRMN